jgi:hypothetical protein
MHPIKRTTMDNNRSPIRVLFFIIDCILGWHLFTNLDMPTNLDFLFKKLKAFDQLKLLFHQFMWDKFYSAPFFW